MMFCCAGVAIVNVHGAAEFASMMGMFEGCLDKQVHDDAGYDKVREGAVILLGTLARHISPADPKVSPVDSSGRLPQFNPITVEGCGITAHQHSA